MTKRWKRILCGVLACVSICTIFTGCGKEEEVVIDKKVVTLPPEEQILPDTYRQNPAITEYMNFTTNIATSIKYPNTNKEQREVCLWRLFDVHTVQIDCMDLIYLGKTTMGEIVENVKKANKDSINYAIESVRAARQAIIDEEYAAEKAKAAAKGKKYDKEKEIADVYDLSYEDPYRVVLGYANPVKKEATQYPYLWDEYQGKKLIDPLVDKVLYLFIYKYDVPYVQCVFESISGAPTYTGTNNEETKVKLYNNLIDQEEDWVLTAISPADCTFLVDQELVTQPGYQLPSYVDADWRSKGAKNNMVTNGNIKFGGEGFTWDSLMTLCNTLELTMKEKGGKSWRAKTTLISNERACTYEQTSDAQFTYYTIYLPINQMFKQKNGDMVLPISTIKVTFDKLTNLCVNWTIDYGRFYHSFPVDIKHQPGDRIPINVRKHQIDTTKYGDMLQTVNDWVVENQTIANFGYYLVDSTGVVIGKIDNGLKNYQVEISVEGVKYYCTKPPMSLSEMKAYYISQSEKDKLTEQGNADNPEALANTEKLYYIMCMAVETDDKGNSYPIGYFNNTGALVDASNAPSGYYIFSIEYDASAGYKNAVIIDQEVFNNLQEMYIRTFRLSPAMQDNLESLYLENDPWRMNQYMTKYTEENLKRQQSIEQSVGSAIDDITKNPALAIRPGELEIIEVEE